MEGLYIKLVEEVGKVAEVLNGHAGQKEGLRDSNEEEAKELADIIHYTVLIATINDIDPTLKRIKQQLSYTSLQRIWSSF